MTGAVGWRCPEKCCSEHCVKRIRIFLVRIFPKFSRIRKIRGNYSARMWKNLGRMWTRITPNTDSFYGVESFCKIYRKGRVSEPLFGRAEYFRLGTLFKITCSTGVFLSNVRKFTEQLFKMTPVNGYLWLTSTLYLIFKQASE